jgi:hypothetical protein
VSDPHFTRERVWVVFTDDSFGVPYAALRGLGINGVYFNAAAAGTPARLGVVPADFARGIFYPANTEHMFGAQVAASINEYRKKWFPADSGRTAVLLDFEPSSGSVQFWLDFIATYRLLMPGRVTDFTPEPFKATALPVRQLLAAKFDVKVQDYFGDMSIVDAYEAGLDWIRGLDDGSGRVGFPSEQIRSFVDGGRHNKPPIFYEGRKVRNLLPGTCIWSANLLREAGLI